MFAVITIVARAELIGGGVGVYFGTDLFRAPAAVENAPVPESMVSNPEPPPVAPIEGDKTRRSERA